MPAVTTVAATAAYSGAGTLASAGAKVCTSIAMRQLAVPISLGAAAIATSVFDILRNSPGINQKDFNNEVFTAARELAGGDLEEIDTKVVNDIWRAHRRGKCSKKPAEELETCVVDNLGKKSEFSSLSPFAGLKTVMSRLFSGTSNAGTKYEVISYKGLWNSNIQLKSLAAQTYSRLGLVLVSLGVATDFLRESVVTNRIAAIYDMCVRYPSDTPIAPVPSKVDIFLTTCTSTNVKLAALVDGFGLEETSLLGTETKNLFDALVSQVAKNVDKTLDRRQGTLAKATDVFDNALKKGIFRADLSPFKLSNANVSSMYAAIRSAQRELFARLNGRKGSMTEKEILDFIGARLREKSTVFSFFASPSEVDSTVTQPLRAAIGAHAENSVIFPTSSANTMFRTLAQEASPEKSKLIDFKALKLERCS